MAKKDYGTDKENSVNKAEKQPKKQVKTETEKSSGGSFKARAAALVQNKKVRIIGMSAIAFILVIALVVGIVVGTKSCKKTGNDGIIDGGNISDDENNGVIDDVIDVDEVKFLPSKSVALEKPVSADSAVLGSADNNPDLGNSYNYEYTNTTAVGYYSEITKKNVKRNKPVEGISDEGLESYPVYGVNYKGSVEQNEIINESNHLTATGTANAGGGGYTWMDENGYLYSGTRPATAENATGRQLYQHTASVGLYRGNVDPDENGVEKTVTMLPRGYSGNDNTGIGYSGYGVTGIYAPAGEVITIKMSGADMNATAGIVIHIGQALYNGQANNIWMGKVMPRIPHLLNTMVVSKDTAVYDEAKDEWTAYVGSFIGGPLYIRNESVSFTVTVSGGVEYPHLILGYTTKEEFNRLRENCSAPYFDLEVWSYGVLHSGSKIFAQNFSYDDLYKAAVLWEKVSSVTTTGSNQGIVFLYEPFVAAGAAVAFPGRRSVNCPEGWMASSLNYNAIVTSGSWGNFHEYHHNFQGYGVGNGGEVTNNAMTLVSYALFTKISSKRGISSFGAEGLGGWNNYTSATWALEQTLKIARPDESPSNGNQGLALYATLLHNFGAENFIQAKVAGGGQSYEAYMNAWQKVTHNNMYYYFNDILKGGVSNNADKSYPMFVPVSCVYQTGRSYIYDGEKKYFKTMQPYVISHDKPFTIDLSEYNAPEGQYESGSIVIPDGFRYSVKSVTQPAHGSIEISDNNNITYKPDVNDKSTTSGQIIVTLQIEKTNGAFKVEDVDLVLEFELSKEVNKMTLERTTYTYSADAMYTDAQTAFENGFKGYDSVVEKADQSNPTQNCNTDIWYRPDTEQAHKDYPDDPDNYFVHDNTIDVIDGKLYFENDGKYRVYLRGRLNCALYFSLDGKTYNLGAAIKDSTAPNKSYLFRDGHPDSSVNSSNTYFDVEFDGGDVTVTVYLGGEKTSKFNIGNSDDKHIVNWLYIKEVLIVQSSPAVSYIGVGMRQWSQTMFTMAELFFDAEGNAVENAESEGYKYTATAYYNYNGTPVAVEVKDKDGPTEYFKIVNNQPVASTQDEVTALTESRLIAPVVTEKSQPYVNAYRNSYEFPDNSSFESDYFYKRAYSYTYRDKYTDLSQSCVGEDPCHENFPIENLFDGDPSTICSSKSLVSASAPLELTVDLGKVIEANRFELTGYKFNNSNNKNETPKSITLLIGETLDSMKEVVSFDNGKVDGIMLKFNFETTRFRYYKLIVRETVEGRFAAIGNIEFSNSITGGTQITPDNANLVFSGDWKTEPALSSFGHVYVGKQGAKLSFDIIGSRVGFTSSSAFGKNFEVYIDGKKVESIGLKQDDGATAMTYLCEALESGTHRVELICTGEANIDSVVVYS